MVTVGMGVTVIVVTYNSEKCLPGLLASLPLGLENLRWQLVVVDNDSKDRTSAIVEDLAPESTVKVAMGRNAGYAAGINAGVAAADPHSALLVLNPDVRLERGCVTELLRALCEPDVGITVPRLMDARGQRIDSMRREPTVLRALGDALLGARRAGRYRRLGEVVTDPRLYEEERYTDWAEGSTQLISAQCWRECGPWDESFFLYSEETDFNLRARDAGFRTRYVPSARATHLEGGSGSTPALWALLTVNRVRLYRRRNGVAGTAAFWCAAVLREASRAVLGHPTSRVAVRALLSPHRLREVPGPHSVA